MGDDAKTATLNQLRAVETRLEAILKSILAENSYLRLAADDEFNKIPPDQKAICLLRIGRHSEASEEVRSLSLDLLSRLLKEIIHTWSSDNLVPFSDELIESISSETNDKIRVKLGDILVQVADQSILLNSGVFAYPSIASFIQTSADNKPIAQKLIALSVIRRVPNIFGIKRLSDLRDYLHKSLADSDASVRLCALKTFFLIVKDDTISTFAALLSSVIQVCAEYVVSEQEPTSDYCPINNLYKMASNHTNIMRPHLDAIIHLCSLITSERSDQERADLTLLLATLIRENYRLVFNDDTFPRDKNLVFFTLNRAPSTDSKVKLAALDIIRHLFVCYGETSSAALFDLFTRRFSDEDSSICAAALATFIYVFENNSENESCSKILALLVPKLIELSEKDFLDEDNYIYHCNPLDVLVRALDLCSDLVVSYGHEMAGLCTAIMATLNATTPDPLYDTLSTVRLDTLHHLRTIVQMTKGKCIVWAPDIMVKLCQQLTIAAFTESDDSYMHRCISLMMIISEGTEPRSDDESWSELRRQINTGDLSYEAKRTLLTIICIIPRVVSVEAPATVARLHKLFENCLADESKQLRQAAWLAVLNYSHRVKDEETIKSLSHIVPLAMKLTEWEDDNSEFGSGGYLEIGLLNPSVVQPYLRMAINYYCDILNEPQPTRRADEREEEWQLRRDGRNLQQLREKEASFRALARLCQQSTCTRCTPVSALIVKSSPSLVPDIVSACLLAMRELDDSDHGKTDWARADNVIEDRDSWKIIERAGEKALADTVTGLTATVVLPFMLQLTETMLTHADWKQRHAGVMGISFVGREFTAENSLETVKKLVPLLDDRVMRIRSAACFALGRIAEGSAPDLLERIHTTMVPALLTAFRNVQIHRVSAEAAVALARFCRAASKPILSIHIAALARTTVVVLESTYEGLLEERRTLILKQTIALIVAAIEAASVQFGQYYDRLIHPLKRILIEAPAFFRPEIYPLTVECVSLVGAAAGKHKFATDAAEVMRSLMARFDSLLTSQFHFASSFARIASAMGDSFLKIHPTVMTTITQAIQTHVVADQGENDVAMIRKYGACRMVVALVPALADSVTPYIRELAELALTHLSMPNDLNDRIWAAEMVPALMSAMKGREEMRDKLWTEYWRGLREVMIREGGRSLAETAHFIRSIALCIEHLEGVPENEREEIDDLVQKEDKSLKARRASREEIKKKAAQDGGYIDREQTEMDEKMDKEVDESITSISMALKRYNFPYPFSFLRRHKWL